jgi:NAD(P)-dependent dehydrogenase (short-subunit alcohol dehydrogenase family)
VADRHEWVTPTGRNARPVGLPTQVELRLNVHKSEGVTDMSKIWFVTGSSRGFGREIVEAALKRGDQVVATARNPNQLGDLSKYGDRVLASALDVTDPAAAKRAIDETLRVFGSLDIVVNNAGFADSAPIEEMTQQSFRAQIETNLFGVVNVTKAALPAFHQRRSGHFLQFSSIGGRVGGTPGMGAYQTAKFAVEGFSEVLNAEAKPLGIKVTIIEPGGFRTDWGGSSMHTSSVGADYEDTVGAMNRFRQSTVSTWRGDPKRAADILLDLVDMDEPPLRLLLGDGAVRSAEESSRERAAEAEMWAEVSRSADFPEGE